MIFGEKEQSVTVVTVVTVFSGGVHAFPYFQSVSIIYILIYLYININI